MLRPNASLSRSQMRILLFFMALIMGTIAAVSVYAGGWLVLPFSGFEWLFLAYCFHLGFKRGAIREVITITENTVQIEKGRDKPEQSWHFQRAWVMMDLAQSPIRGHPSKLYMRLHGRCVEVGGFLVENERLALARELKGLLGSR